MPGPTPLNKKQSWCFHEECKQQKLDYYPKISIVTPSFNQGEYIEETIRSVLLQNYPNLEYIIIDGGSTDETVEIIRKYESGITYWISEPDGGQTYALNKGIGKCTGEIFNWLNSDDFLEKDALWKIAEAYKPETDFYCGITRDINSNYQELSRKGSRLPDGELKRFSSLHSHLHQPGTYQKLSVLKEFPMNPDLHYTMDLDFWLKYLLTRRENAKLEYIDEVLVNFRIHDNSKTGSENAIKAFWNDIYWLYSGIAHFYGFSALSRKIKNLAPKVQPEVFHFELKNSALAKNEIEKILHHFLKYMGDARLKHGETKKALAHYKLVNSKFLRKSEKKSFRNLKWGLRFPFLTKLIGKK